MPRAIDPQRLDLLILGRLAAQGKKTLSAHELGQQLFPFVETVLSRPEWRRTLDERLDSLRSSGLVEGSRVSEAGRRQLLDAIEQQRVPPWRALREVFLPAVALGLAPGSPKVRKRLRDADGLRASVLHREHELPVGDLPTLTRVIDALVWRALGVETDRPITAAAIRAHFLTELLGGSSRVKPDKLAALLAARASEAPSPDARVVRLALVRKWLTESEPAADRARSKEGAAGPSLEERARRIQEVLPEIRDGRFGDRKVFIAAAWRALRDDPLFAGVDFDRFKDLLIQAHVAGFLILHRADLVGAMDEEEIRESEINYLNATFHFIESESGRDDPNTDE